jgi:hypothetical protein
MDLFRYASDRRRNLPDAAKTAPTRQAYFSVDGGATPVGYWNNGSDPCDYGDWQTNQTTGRGSGPTPYDSLNAATGPGYVTSWSPGDTELMNVLGWNVAGQGPAQRLEIRCRHNSWQPPAPSPPQEADL